MRIVIIAIAVITNKIFMLIEWAFKTTLAASLGKCTEITIVAVNSPEL